MQKFIAFMILFVVFAIGINYLIWTEKRDRKLMEVEFCFSEYEEDGAPVLETVRNCEPGEEPGLIWK